MKRLIVLVLLCFAAGVWLFEQIQHDAGYILISLGGKSYETSFWFAVLALLTVISVVSFMLYLISIVVKSVIRGSRWFGAQRHHSIERHYREGLLQFLTGNWQEAGKQLSALSKHNDLPVVRAIAAAQSFAQLGQADKALRHLEDAENKYGDDVVWILKARFSILLDLAKEDESRFQAAKNVLSQLKVHQPRDPIVKSLDLKYVMMQSNALEATRTIPQLIKHKDTHSDEVVDKYEQALEQLREDPKLDLEQLDQYWGQVPKKLKNENTLIVAYAKTLFQIKQYSLLEKLIVHTLYKTWLPELVDIYAKLDTDQPDEQLKKAEMWLKKHDDCQTLLMCLGVLSYKCQLWGKAKSYFEQSIKVKESHQAVYFLGVVAEKLGEMEQSQGYFKRAAGLNM